MNTSNTSPESGIWRRNLEGWARALFEGIDDAVFVHDLRGRILDVNPAACRRLGYTREELLRMQTRDIDDPEFATGFNQRLEQQMTAGHFRCEGKHRTKDGRTVLVDINTSAIEFNGRPCILAVMRDITESKEAELQLRKQSELLASILENLGDGVLVVDPSERLLLCNTAAERLLGLPHVEGAALPQWPPAAALFQSDQVTPFPPRAFPWSRAATGRTVSDVEMHVQPRAGARGVWVSMNARPLCDENGQVRGGVVVCRDITERKRAERRQTVQNAIARVLTSATSGGEIGTALLRTLCEGLGWDLAAIWVVNKKDLQLRCHEVWHRPELPLSDFTAQTRSSSFSRGRGLPGRVWARSSPLWVAAPAQEPGLLQRSLPPGLEFRAFAFPIWSQGTISGVVEALTRTLESPDDDVLTLTATLGSQIGQLIEQQLTTRALRESQAFYHSLVETLPQNLFRKDRDGRLTFANQRYCQLTKKPLADLIGKTDFDLFPEPLARKYREDDEQVYATRVPLELVEEHRLPSGRAIYVQVIKTPIFDEAGNCIGIQGLFWDVTEKKRAEEAIAESERRYRQLTEATLDAIVVMDSTGQITLFNPAAERLFGYQANEVVGQPFELLIPGDTTEAGAAPSGSFVERRAAQMVGRTVELNGRRSDGTSFPLELALSAIEWHDPRRPGSPVRRQFLGAIRDLTERNRIRLALVQNEKLASIGLLSAGVAHEINNPLAFVSNNLAVLQRDLAGVMQLLQVYEDHHEQLAQVVPATAQRATELAEEIDLAYIKDNLDRLLTKTREGVERVNRIVQSLRSLARTGKPQRQRVLLPDLIESALEIVRNKMRRLGVEVELDYDPDPTVNCVASQIGQVFLNMIVNAIQAMETVERPGGHRLTIGIHRQAAEMLIAIADTGCGIAAEHLARLFDPFFTTKEVGEGTGLGLSISHNIVTAHGGRIEVESELNAGATFRIFLPLNPS